MAVNPTLYDRKVRELKSQGVDPAEAHLMAINYASVPTTLEEKMPEPAADTVDEGLLFREDRPMVKKGDVLMTSPTTKEYEEYRRDVRRMGGKEIATPEQYREIKRRLASRIAKRKKKRKKKTKKLGLYPDYAKQTGQPDFSSAGSDAEMLRKKFLRKK